MDWLTDILNTPITPTHEPTYELVAAGGIPEPVPSPVTFPEGVDPYEFGRQMAMNSRGHITPAMIAYARHILADVAQTEEHRQFLRGYLASVESEL